MAGRTATLATFAAMTDVTTATRLPAAERRRQLLDTALTVFARQGYHETSMNALAAEAGITKPVLYQHFASKRQLFIELLAEVGENLLAAVANSATPGAHPRQRVEAGFCAYFRFFDDHPDAFSVLYGPALGQDAEFRKGAQRVQEDFAAVVARLINAADADDAVVMAWGVNGLSEGMIRHWMHDGRRRSASEMAALTTRLAWGGLERLV